MSNNITTKHFIVDPQTGFAYGLKLDGEGNCLAIQPLDSQISAADGRVVSEHKAPVDGEQFILPYGKTMYALEMNAEGGQAVIFTIAWPSKKDMESGILPSVARKQLPADLVQAGLAARVKAAGKDAEEDAALKEALRQIESMIGLDSAKRDIKQNIAIAQFNRAKEELGLPTKPISRHMVFTGNPGTGKTTFAREVAKVYHALGFIDKPTVHEVKREDLVAGFVGQTAIKTKEAIEKAKGGILFIDEAYALSRGGYGNDNDFGKEAIDTLVAAMENMRENLIVIVAGYTEPMKRFIDANEGLKSRFMTYINFDDYGMTDLGKIMDVMLQDRGYTMEPAARQEAMKLLEEERTRAGQNFGNGRSVRNMVEKAEKEMALRLQTENKLGAKTGLSKEELKAAFTTITLKDIQAITLAGLDAKSTNARNKIGFDFSAAKAKTLEAANDQVPTQNKKQNKGAGNKM